MEFHVAILDSINDGVLTVDLDLRITSFNRAAERITGVSREDAIGRRCADVLRCSICDAFCVLRKTLEGGAQVNQSHKTAYLVNARTGVRVPVHISTAVLHDDEGRVIGAVDTFHDISYVEQLRKELTARYSVGDLIGRSSAMRKLFDVLPIIASSDSTVLIEGESGTGKELAARALHEMSSRRDKRFVAINCGALPDTLLESELFGYKAGAFTDARRDRPGRFAAAEGGTIFLDEIGDISLAMQVRLLRVLQEKSYEPLGSSEPVKTNVRIMAATHRNLSLLIAEGRFREDLFYRINVIRLKLLPLRDRREDIPLLVDHFVRKYNLLRHKEIAGLSEEAARIVIEHEYPGNVRELENIIEHAFVLCGGGFIQPDHLPASLRREADADASADSGRTLRDLEKLAIEEALRKHVGNRTAAARELGIDPSTLFRKVRAFHLRLPGRNGRFKVVK